MAKNFVFVCGFAQMATADLVKKWTSAGSLSINSSTANTPFGYGRNLLMSNPGYVTLPATTTKVCVGGWFFFNTSSFNSAGTGSNVLLAAMDGSTNQCFIGIDILGRITLFNGSGTLLGVSTGQKIWSVGTYHIEAQFTISTSTGAGDCKVWVNGELAFSCAAGLNTRNTANTYASAVGFGHSNITNLYGSDFFIVDWSSGDAPPVGMRRIYNCGPTGDGTTNNFVGSDGNSVSNYLLVDDVPYDGADYTGSATAAEVDLYGLADLPSTPLSIDLVQVVNAVSKSDAGARTGRNIIRSGSTNYDSGVDISPGTSFLLYSSMWLTDPNTSAAWAAAGVNALQAGLKVQS